jgi:hypothetical protein
MTITIRNLQFYMSQVSNEPDCPEGQKPGLFTTCMPIQSCPDQLGRGGVAINSPNTNNCVNVPGGRPSIDKRIENNGLLHTNR